MSVRDGVTATIIIIVKLFPYILNGITVRLKHSYIYTYTYIYLYVHFVSRMEISVLQSPCRIGGAAGNASFNSTQLSRQLCNRKQT